MGKKGPVELDFNLEFVNVFIVKLMKVWVNGGSNYYSLKVAKCLVI